MDHDLAEDYKVTGLMSNSDRLLTPKKLAKLVKQLDPNQQVSLIQELVSLLDSDLLETMKIEAEQEWILRKLDRVEELEEQDQQPARHFEFKKVKHQYYAYLRWREEGCHKSQYLGPMPFLPGRTYTLCRKQNDTKKVFTSLGLEIEDDQIYLKVQMLNPTHTIQSYLYPECLNTIFNKKEWAIQAVTFSQNEKEEFKWYCQLNPQVG